MTNTVIKILRTPYKCFNYWWVLVKYTDAQNNIRTINLLFNSEEEALKLKIDDKF